MFNIKKYYIDISHHHYICDTILKKRDDVDVLI